MPDEKTTVAPAAKLEQPEAQAEGLEQAPALAKVGSGVAAVAKTDVARGLLTEEEAKAKCRGQHGEPERDPSKFGETAARAAAANAEAKARKAA